MKDVIIYTSDGCQYCHVAKDYMDEDDVKYTEKNISQDQEAKKELVEKDRMGVPITIIGDEEIVGSDQAKLKETLGL